MIAPFSSTISATEVVVDGVDDAGYPFSVKFSSSEDRGSVAIRCSSRSNHVFHGRVKSGERRVRQRSSRRARHGAGGGQNTKAGCAGGGGGIILCGFSFPISAYASALAIPLLLPLVPGGGGGGTGTESGAATISTSKSCSASRPMTSLRRSFRLSTLCARSPSAFERHFCMESA